MSDCFIGVSDVIKLLSFTDPTANNTGRSARQLAAKLAADEHRDLPPVKSSVSLRRTSKWLVEFNRCSDNLAGFQIKLAKTPETKAELSCNPG